MTFGKSALLSAVGGVILGAVIAFGINTAVAQNTIPEAQQPPADQALLGQVQYGARS